MEEATIIGVDLAKNGFQVRGARDSPGPEETVAAAVYPVQDDTPAERFNVSGAPIPPI
jgi:hypothetical protein